MTANEEVSDLSKPGPDKIFEEFMDMVDGGVLDTDKLRELPGLTKLQLDEFIKLMDTSADLARAYPFGLVLRHRRRGRPSTHTHEQLDIMLTVLEQVGEQKRLLGTVTAAVTMVAKTKGMSEEDVWKRYQAAKRHVRQSRKAIKPKSTI